MEKNAKAKGLNVPVKENGFPNFVNYLYPRFPSVFIHLTGHRKKDFRDSNRARAKEAIGTVKATTPSGYTWHHHEVVGVMQPVKTKTHPSGGGLKRAGGAFYYTVLNNIDKYR